MKTKITRFILVITFGIFAVYCNVDTKEFHIPFRPEPPDYEQFFNDEDNDPILETPANSSSEDENDIYEPYFNDNEMILVRQTLIGTYRGILNNQYTTLEVRTPNTLYIIRNGEERAYNYELRLEQYGVCIVFTAEEIEHRYFIGTTDYPGGNLRVIRFFTDNNHFLDKEEDMIDHNEL